VLIYFPPEGEKGSHGFFRTKMMQEISAELGCVRVSYSKTDPLREELKVPKDLHVLHVCDWYANSLKAFSVRANEKFPYPTIDALLKQVQKTVDALLKKLEVNLKNAEQKIEKPDAIEALKALGDLATLKGHEIVARAKPVIAKIEEAAGKEIEAALKIEDKKARAKEFEKIKARSKNLRSVEDRCDQEIERATGMAPARDTGSALVRVETAEAVDALLASIDFSKRAPSIVERAQQAMVDGIACEVREEYEKALEFYAMAAGLDTRDSIALTYLGELYRHHLGRWSEARRTFERVVELNNNDLAMAVSLHGLGKMTIWEGNNAKGLELFEASIKRMPTALCYRNLAVFWNTEGEFKKAFGYATQAFDLNPADPYNQVFYSIYLILDGQSDKGEALIKKAQFDPSMAYNYACYYAAQGKDELALKYLHRHFYGYERFDDVRRFEMAEARMDIHFKKYKDDPRFLELTALAAK
jgi:tetratricopeptide (TPR) repeat protein